MLKAVKFLDLLIFGLLAGSTFGVWAGYNPKEMPATVYVGQQQCAIRGFNTLLPMLGLVSIILTGTWAIQMRREKPTLMLLAGALGCMIGAAAVTRFLNQPINAQVIQWSLDSPPGNWTELRDQWWKWHQLRTLLSLVAYALLVGSSIARSDRPAAAPPGPSTIPRS